MLYVLNYDFHFFAYRKITKFCRSVHFGLLFSDILSKLGFFWYIKYPLCFKKQKLELLQYLSFRVELSTNDPRNISFLVLKSIPTWKKLLQGHRTILIYLGLKILQFQPRKGNFLLYPYSKVQYSLQLAYTVGAKHLSANWRCPPFGKFFNIGFNFENKAFFYI